ncbi:MAG TPA: hypothetical protein PLN13_09415 [Bacteroidia bacterium]|nr:hypothetical protein [Bacteroidia bacterium]HRH08787.1 hypothetical protein [Bacteroidia bacterium]
MSKQKNVPKLKHRGRFQAQGSNLEKSSAWAQNEGLTYEDGKMVFEKLVNILTNRERQERMNYIIECSEDIKQAHSNGGYIEQVFKTFPKVGRPNGVRIDLEVHSGVAFI